MLTTLPQLPATVLVSSALLGLLLFGLGLSISMLRFRTGILRGGDERHPDALINRVIRAHANTAEFAPMLVVLFVAHGLQHPQLPVWLQGLIVTATACRLLLVIGLIAWPTMSRPNPARFIGALGTYLCGSALAVALLV